MQTRRLKGVAPHNSYVMIAPSTPMSSPSWWAVPLPFTMLGINVSSSACGANCLMGPGYVGIGGSKLGRGGNQKCNSRFFLAQLPTPKK